MLDCMDSPFTKITCILTFSPASLEQFLRAVWGVISLAAALISLPMKHPSLTLCSFFKLSSSHKRIQNRGCGWVLMDHPYSLNHLDKHAKTLPSGPTLWDPLNRSPPDSSVHGILQARIMEWVAISSSRGSP